MNLPAPSYRSNGTPASSAVPDSSWIERPSQALELAPLSLDQILEKAYKHLACVVQVLPEPWPGCVLIFSITHGDEAATVFSITANTFHSAWREGSIRARQWAWARRLDSASLRIDWAEEVAQQGLANQRLSSRGLDKLVKKNGALTDPSFEHTVLLQQALGCSATALPEWLQPILASKAAPQPFLILHMRGVFIEPFAAAVSSFPRSTLASQWLIKDASRMDLGLRLAASPAFMGLIMQQLPSGTWPQIHSLCEHLIVQHSLLLELRSERLNGQPSAAYQAITQAIARATDYAIEHVNPAPHEQAFALLVVAISTKEGIHSVDNKPLLYAKLNVLASQVQQAFGLNVCKDQLQPESLHAQAIESPKAIAILQLLALQAYAFCGARQSSPHSAANVDWPSELPPSWLQMLVQHFERPYNHKPEWLGTALIEAHELHASLQLSTSNGLLCHRRMLKQLDGLHQRFIWPELAIFLTQEQQKQAFFITERPFFDQTKPSTSQQAFLLIQTAASVALVQWLEQSQAAISLEQQASSGEQSHDHVPMRWSSQHLAQLTEGTWLLPHGMKTPPAVTGLTVTRHNHAPGAAVLVRQQGDSLGVHPAMTATLRPSALILASKGNAPATDLPILQIPNLAKALDTLAHTARQRVQAKVIAITGCVGKTSTLRMLAQCLLGTSASYQGPMLQQDSTLQMINWSDSAPWVLAELSLEKAPQHLAMLAPDILVVTNFPQELLWPDTARSQEYAQQKILQLMPLMRRGSVLVFNGALAGSAALQAMATRCDIRLISFGPHDQATLVEHGYDNDGLLAVKLQTTPTPDQAPGTDVVEIQLQAHGHHMALNAQAALTVLHALELPLTTSASALVRWSPLPGAGKSEYFPENIALLDHSNTSEILATRAAFAHLLMHAPQACQRVVVFGGVRAHHSDAENLYTAQLQIAPLIRSTATRRVLLYGIAMADLAQQLHDQPHVSWYEDLNQLIKSLLYSLQPHDAVLLVGRALVNLGIVANAIRELSYEA